MLSVCGPRLLTAIAVSESITVLKYESLFSSKYKGRQSEN